MSLATLPPVGRILLVDRDPYVAAARQLFELAHCPVTVVGDALGGRRALDDQGFDLLIVDADTVGNAGLALLRAHSSDVTDIPIVVTLSAERLGETGTLLALGAFACVRKPCDPDELLLVVRRALHDRVRRRELVRLRAELRQGAAARIVGRSTAMQHVRDLVGRAAETRAPLTVVGEPGTGKELVARVVHALDAGEGRPLVVLDCASTTMSDAAAVLFGRSDAGHERPGLVEDAYGGTLVLLHAELLPMPAMARLSRALEDREALRGDRGPSVPIDVRLICTRRERASEAAALRPELVARGRSLVIELPPLNRRRSDIPALVRHFRARIEDESGTALPELEGAMLSRLATSDWPGNVRQLEHAVERLSLGMGDPGPTTAAAERAAQPAPSHDPLQGALASGWSMAELERRYILGMLVRLRGNQSRAAALLGIDRRTLYRKLKEYGTDARSVCEEPAPAVESPRPSGAGEPRTRRLAS